ncbi:UdgX family uracil-DNA binding protein [Roseicyclus sp. F158]|uniref:Type-4 uracil-DNA glycosylase n=1 Tax=Tropicimonas omnivorans TaxID=3075590 RepID=A0ABU3DGF5_9RHOB|nr:UdgX family uracil-DNA binding protein [Roseicyclus sp. F158]MDT0682774.1 UdgX family uracil-DNA binding protein [Roseicyclus sp. F158]
MRVVVLPRIGTSEAWRAEARALAGEGVRPEDVSWSRGEASPGLLDGMSAPSGTPRTLTVPRAFPNFADAVICHSDPERFALLYALLLRLQDRPGLLADRADPQVGRLRKLEKAVHRDMHKMKAFVRFREVGAPDPETGRRSFVSWFEPDHYIAEAMAGFFTRRFASMSWIIATPDMGIAWDGTRSELIPDPPRPPDGEDAAEDLWRTYYANIFNPARLMVKAMQSEMPKKYWRNLPEARLIPDLIASAPARVDAMRAAEASEPTPTAVAVARRRETDMDLFLPRNIPGLAKEAAGCTRCPLHGPATQTVFGEGPEDAPLMFVGEQPGDNEDLEGRPFVGPAGQLFDACARKAGIDRDAAYVTNAVKHFKFTPRGKSRIHQRPSAGEVSACRWWLESEAEVIRPALFVALGATALHALTGDGKGILKRRGSFERGRFGAPVFVTVHPSYLLRLPDASKRAEEEARFVEDLAAVQEELGRLVA